MCRSETMPWPTRASKRASSKPRSMTTTSPDRCASSSPAASSSLDVEVLHRTLLAGLLGIQDPEHQVAYSSDLAAACRQVDRGEFATVVALRPAPFSSVVDVAQRGRILPPKTTFFHPKPRDGLVLRPLHP